MTALNHTLNPDNSFIQILKHTLNPDNYSLHSSRSWTIIIIISNLEPRQLLSYFIHLYLDPYSESRQLLTSLYPLQTLVVVGYTVFMLSVHPLVHPWHFGFFLISWKRSDGYPSISADSLISIRYTYILPFVKFLNAVKSLCAHY